MKVCFPVEKNEGLASTVYNHFGSAPFFVLVDTASNTVAPVANADQVHSKGACSPIKALGSQRVDAVVVGGIGGGALGKLNQLGIKVYKAQPGSIEGNLELFASGQLSEYAVQMCCGGHDAGGGCAH
ncbi:MAG: diguanylate cyclase [Thermodesulfovibrio sp.]|nr:diguanylate cyclase [Thermodesulfovibrio sp.]